MSQKKNRQQRKPKSEVKLAEERFQNCIEKRNSLNEESRTIRDERNSLHDQRNKVMKEVLKYRKKMEVNKKTKAKHIKSRDSAMSKVKQLNELKQKKRKGRNKLRSCSHRRETEKKKEEEERYHVVQIGLKFEVVQKKNFGSVKKGAPKKYKAQVSEYQKGRAEAKKNGEKFKGLKPPSTVFKVLTKKGFKGQKEAKSYADNLQKKVDSKRKK